MKKRIRSSKERGTLAVLILLFVSSAGLRIVTSADEVIAATSIPKDTAMSAPDVDAPDMKEMDGVLKAFAVREERIRKQEEQISKRMKALTIADERVSQRLVELKQAEENLRATLALASTAAEDDLSRLTTVYENMKPKTAAALFQEMAPEFAAGFLGRMRPDSAAAVMAGMTPESAYTVSAILAGRNSEVPKK